MTEKTANRTGRKPWTRGEKALLGVIGVVVAGVGGVGWWWHELNAPVVANIPSPTLPSPNAFDYFVNAHAQFKSEGATGDALRSRDSKHVYTDRDRAALAAENAPMLSTLREGLQYPYCSPPARSFDAPLPYFAKFRSEARALSLDAQVKAAQGDTAGAVNSGLDAMQMGVMVPHGSVLIGDLVGLAIEEIGRRPLWQNIDRLTEAEARAAARRLETVNAQRVPYADVVQEEKWSGQAGLMKFFQGRNTFQFGREFSSMAAGDGTGPSQAERSGLTLRIGLRSKRSHFAAYTGTLDASIAQAKRPYIPGDNGPALPDDPVVQMLSPVFPSAQFKHQAAEMADNLLTVAVALRAYHARRNDYPTSLDALVRDGILTRVPPDPFAPALNAPLRYRRNGDGTYTLYSVGPDGRDDGGKPVSATQQSDKTKPRYFPEREDKGDWVVGVNTPRD